jgi:hypothetical protein
MEPTMERVKRTTQVRRLVRARLAMLLRIDHPRRIDRVIDYFGEPARPDGQSRSTRWRYAATVTGQPSWSPIR